MKIFENQRGSAAMIWAVAVLPICIVVAAALDFNHRETTQSEMKSAADAAAIAAARLSIEGEASADAVKAFAADYFNENLAHTIYSGTVVPEIEVVPNVSVTVSAKYKKPTFMLSLIGIQTLGVKVESMAAYSQPAGIEAVMVLDNSYSMVGSKMVALQEAAGFFVDEVVTDGDDKIRVGIVPFNNFVNVGIANRKASWLDVPAPYTEKYNQCSIDTAASKANGCSKVASTCSNDGVVTSCQKWSCPKGKSTVSSCTEKTRKYDWYGCVKSREAPLHIQDASFSTKKVPGLMQTSASGCGSALLPLTSDVSAAKKSIKALKPSSDTYIATGLTWGLRVLSAQSPFDQGAQEAAFYADDGQKILILMSDGANTRSRSSTDGNHNKSDVADADATTVALCNEIKTYGAQVYTIAFDVDDADLIALLKGCASAPAQFFDAKDSDALKKAFRSISIDMREITLKK